MAEITIRDSVWKDLLALAKRQRRKPNVLVETAVCDYLDRVADIDLLAQSRREARQTGIRTADIEEAIRRHTRKQAHLLHRKSQKSWRQ
jgi:hypothetical protein